MRIIAGKLKGMTLHTFDFLSTRPTTDKVRQAVFNMIQFDIKNSTFLDLFAGSGSVSLEAISRGASRVVVVENNQASIKLIKKNFEKTKQPLTLIAMDYKKAINKLAAEQEVFDFIYLDPPFESSYLNQALKMIDEGNLLKLTGLIICEQDKTKDIEIPLNFDIKNSKKYGSIAITTVGYKDV